MNTSKPWPQAFETEAHKRWGPLAEIRLKNLLGRPEKSIRLNPQKKSTPKVRTTNPIPWCSKGFYVDEDSVFITDPAWHAGAYYVQEASSMALASVCEQIPKFSCALDLCAAPGGKTTLLLDYLHPEGLLLANEPEAKRHTILQENLCRRGDPRVVTCRMWPEHFPEYLNGKFDLVLVDAPCSGEGMFRKEAAAREQWSLSLLQRCESIQAQILPQAARLLETGGYLIYSTCTFNPHENQLLLQKLMPELGFEPVSIRMEPAWGFLPDEYGFGHYAYPGEVRGEGFYFSVWKKVEKTQEFPCKIKPKHGSKSVPIPSELKAWTGRLPWRILTDFSGNLCLMSDAIVEFLPLLPECKISGIGVFAGETIKSNFVPDHALAMLPGLQTSASVSLHESEALNYLRGEALQPDSSWPKGYVPVLYNGLTLGWLNNLGNRTNNKYPRSFRILHY